MLSESQRDRLRRLALRLAGLELLDRHDALLERRCARLGGGLDALLEAAERGETHARHVLLGVLTTNVSSFFRNPRHFDLASEHALWAAQRRGSARLWSAGTATGEEAWSLAFAVLDVFRREDPPVSILATDIDEDALAVARQGEYAESATCGIPAALRAQRFVAAGPGRWRVGGSARRLVEFRTLNLADASWPALGPFDAVLCRNVLMYLSQGHRAAVLERLASVLAPDGLLLLDPAEHAGDAQHLFCGGGDGVLTLAAPWRALPPKPGSGTPPP